MGEEYSLPETWAEGTACIFNVPKLIYRGKENSLEGLTAMKYSGPELAQTNCLESPSHMTPTQPEKGKGRGYSEVQS